ncbi:hypothetical protein [Psychrobacillus sp. FSL H8-0510]|uniref:hypothetical protein n=1 Tax=Psychrobacillus sp. FSL H8-0510 TaxID=2921394 RepID=UPI0030FC67CC
MRDVNLCASTLIDAVSVASALPQPGNLQLNDQVNLIRRRGLMKKLVQIIYEGKKIPEIMETEIEKGATDLTETATCYFDQIGPGVRFSQKADYFYHFVLLHEEKRYKLTFPIFEQNIEALLVGAIWATEPEKFLQLSEYSITIESNNTKRPKKYLMTPNEKRITLRPELFILFLELEDKAMYGLMDRNIKRAESYICNDDGDFKDDLYLLLNWSIAYNDVVSSNQHSGIDNYDLDIFYNFEQFKSWAIQNGYVRGARLEQVDLLKPVSPSNYEWIDPNLVFPKASLIEKKASFRPTRYYANIDYTKFEPFAVQMSIEVTHDGKTQSIREWSEETGLRIDLLYNRYLMNKSSFLDPDVKRMHEWPINYEGETLSVREWANRLNIPETTIINRIKLGWEAERLLQQVKK